MANFTENQKARLSDDLLACYGERPIAIDCHPDAWMARFANELPALRMAWKYKDTAGVQCKFLKHIKAWSVWVPVAA
jgi:hypothetical protein